MFTVVMARNDLLLKLGVDTPANATTGQLADVAFAINWALQTMHTAGETFFTRTKLALTCATGAVAFPANVQSVLGPVRLPTGVPLRALSSRGELDAYGALFMGQLAYAVAAGTPQAYWVENTRAPIVSAATDAEMTKITLNLVPAPSSSLVMEVEGIEECVNYLVADLADTDPLACPHQYVESIFLPLARYAITLSNDFSRAELRPEIEKAFRLAMASLGLAGGFPPERKADNREVNA